MKIVEAPTVRLVGSTRMEWDPILDFLSTEVDAPDWRSDGESDGEKLIEIAGRCCYLSFSKPRPGGNKAYIGHILEVGHGSVLEHANYNFLITGISRTCSHEFVRHRAGWAYSQLSQRYVDESVAEYVIPQNINRSPEARRQWENGIGKAHEEYQEMLALLITNEECPTCASAGSLSADASECGNCGKLSVEQRTEIRKAVRQSARSLLPNACETKIFGTCNGRAARHFLEMRGSRHAESEIRAVALEMLEILQLESPALFGDYKVHEFKPDQYEIVTQHRKV